MRTKPAVAIWIFVLFAFSLISAYLTQSQAMQSIGTGFAGALHLQGTLGSGVAKHLIPRCIGLLWAFALGLTYLAFVPFTTETKSQKIVFMAGLLPALVIAVLLGTRRDYWDYVREWQWDLQGRNPWTMPSEYTTFPKNPYGPLFNIFAPLTLASIYLPKIIFVLVDFHFFRLLARRLNWNRKLFLLFFSPFLAIEVIVNGHMDSLVGALCIAAFLTSNEWAAASSLAAAMLLKFYPALLIPMFFGLRKNGRATRTVALSLLLVFCLGLAYALWGKEIFTPFRTNATRYVQGVGFNYAFNSLARRFVGLAASRMVLKFVFIFGTLGTIVCCYMRRMEPFSAAFVTLLWVFNFNTVTNIQYMAVLVYLAAFLLWPELQGQKEPAPKPLINSLLIFVLALNCVESINESNAQLHLRLDERILHLNFSESVLIGMCSVLLYSQVMRYGRKQSIILE